MNANWYTKPAMAAPRSGPTQYIQWLAHILTTGGYGPPTIRAGATFLLEYRSACLTNGNHYDVLQLYIWGHTWVTMPVVIYSDLLWPSSC